MTTPMGPHKAPLNVLPAAPIKSPQPVVDLGIRFIHIGLILTFLVSYLTSESERWRLVHVYSGYTLFAVLVFRLVWGLIGPASARWRVLLRRVGIWRIWWQQCLAGSWWTQPFLLGVTRWLLSASMFAIYTFCWITTLSGWASYMALFGDSSLGDGLEDLHEGLGNATLIAVVMHVSLVIVLRVWRGPRALRPMWRGHANTPR